MDTDEHRCFCVQVKLLRRWRHLGQVLLGLLLFLIVFCLWARVRDAKRFEPSPVGENELRVMTWNVGYFTVVSDKNMRKKDYELVADIVLKSESQVVILQEVGSMEMGHLIASQCGEFSNDEWSFAGVKTGLGNQVLGVLTQMKINRHDVKEAGEKKVVGFDLKGGGIGLYVVGVHAPHPIRRGEENTIAAIEAAFDLAREKGGGQSLVMGDLNWDFDEESQAELYANLQEDFVDETKEIGETYYAGKRLDYVFRKKTTSWTMKMEASGMMELSSGTINPSVPGFRDHWPVVVAFGLEE